MSRLRGSVIKTFFFFDRFALTLDPNDEASLNGLSDLCQQSNDNGITSSRSGPSLYQHNSLDAACSSSQQNAVVVTTSSSWVSTSTGSSSLVTPDISSITVADASMTSSSIHGLPPPVAANVTNAPSRPTRVVSAAVTTAAMMIPTPTTTTSTPSSLDYQDTVDDSTTMDT